MRTGSINRAHGILGVLLVAFGCCLFCNFSPFLFSHASLRSPSLLEVDRDYSTSGDKSVSGIPDSEMLLKFSHLLPGFKSLEFALEADSRIVSDSIKKESSKKEDEVLNEYQLDGVSVRTSYSRSKNISLGSASEPSNIKQLVTLTNHSSADKVITLKSKSQISATTVLWNEKEYQLSNTPISFKAFEKTAPVTTYAKDIGASQVEGLEAFKNYTHSYYVGSSLSFAGDTGLATYDWKDVQGMNHEVLAYLEEGTPVIELVLYNLEVPANSEIVIDPEYVLDNSTNYTARITGDAQIGSLGSSIRTGDVNSDGVSDLVTLVSQTGYTPLGGSVFVVFGSAGINTGIQPLSTTTNYNVRYDSNDSLDYMEIGDINSDGLGDLVISSYSASNTGSLTGSAYVIFSTLIDDVGTTTGNNKPLATSSNYNIRYDGAVDSDQLTYEGVLTIGDVNGDGFGDLVFGAPRASNNANNWSGSVWVVFSTLIDDVGASTGNNKPLSTATNYNIRYDGGAVSDQLAGSKSLKIGDINGDGLGDLILGSYGADNNGSTSGSAWVMFSTLIDDVGATTGNNKILSTASNYNTRYDGPGANSYLSADSAIAVSDLNGDGLGDLVLASGYTDYNGNNNSGSAWVIFSTLIDDIGATTGNNKNLSTAGNYNIRYDGAATNYQCPYNGAIRTGDINGDGLADLVLGTRLAGFAGSNSGSAYVIFSTLIDDVGATTGNNKVLSTGTNYNIRYDGAAVTDYLTDKNMIIGDVNGDGFGDLVLGAIYSDNNGVNSGSAWVMFSTLIDDIGATTGNVKSLGTATNYNIRFDGASDSDSLTAGGAVAIGDINEDGFGELFLGAYQADNNGYNSGSFWAIFSSLIDDVGNTTGNNFALDDSGNYSSRYDGDVAVTYVSNGVAIGDLNGDSIPDFAISASTSYNGSDAGSVFVIFGDDVHVAGNISLGVLSNYNIRYDGAAASDYLDVMPTIGDINGDGFGDLILTSSEADNNGADSVLSG